MNHYVLLNQPNKIFITNNKSMFAFWNHHQVLNQHQSSSKNVKHQLHLHHHQWSFVNDHQLHQHHHHLSFVRIEQQKTKFSFLFPTNNTHIHSFVSKANVHQHHQLNNNHKLSKKFYQHRRLHLVKLLSNDSQHHHKNHVKLSTKNGYLIKKQRNDLLLSNEHLLLKCKFLFSLQEFNRIYSSVRPPKNVIIEYEQPKAHHEQIIIDEGVFRADPNSHNATSTIG